MLLGRRVREERTKRKMSQLALATAAGLTQSMISQIEHGGVDNAGWITVQEIERALGLRHGHLTRESRES